MNQEAASQKSVTSSSLHDHRPAERSPLMTWIGWVISKLARGLSLLIGSSFIIYTVLRSAPGDMVDLILGLNGTPEMKADLRAEFGLDLSLVEGYLGWASRALTGDLGISITFMPGEPVLELAGPAFLVTLGIAIVSLFMSIAVAYGLAIFLGPPRPRQTLLLGPIQLLNAAPSFVVAICLAKLINELIQFQLAGGGQIPPSWYPIPTYQRLSDSIAPFVFAALSISLGDGLFTDLFNALRSELNNLSNSLFINAVRAKGASVRPHLVKNLIVPTLSIFTARLPLVLSAVVIVEYIFTLDGSGYLLLQAAKNRDVPVVVGVSLFFILAVIVMNLILDLVKALVDPREVAKGE